MAAATYTNTLSSVGVNKIWRKVQGELGVGFGFDVPEWDTMQSLKDYKINVSAREITVPIDINEGAGIASIDEGAQEALPSSPNVEELTLNYVLFNGRFTASVTAELLDLHQRAAELKRQIIYQGQKKLQDLARHWGDYSYGLTTAVLCQTSTNATQASGTYTIKNLYGQTSSNNAAQLADKWKVGDRVAAVRASALLTNGIGTVTAVTAATPSIAITWNGSVDTDDLDFFVKANSIENTTLVGTDFNRGMTGLIDMAQTTSVHSLSGSSVPNWNAAYAKTTAGRFSSVEFIRGKQEIGFNGGGKADRILMAPGVYRDAIALQSGVLRFNDPLALEMDADLKTGGVKMFQSKRVPAGYVFMFDSDSVRKLDVMPKPDNQFAWGDGIRQQDTSGYTFPVSMLTQMVCTNRKNIAYWSSQTES